MMNFTFKDAEEHLIYNTISGSKSYGLDVPTSDTDIRGIYLQPNRYLLSYGYKELVNDEKNDIVYYELNRFVTLLTQNNPNIIEMLYVPEDKILHFNKKIQPLYDHRDDFLTKKIHLTFGGYAISQIKKARGLNKKIVNPIDEVKKTPLDFCYVIEKDNGYMMTATQWLDRHQLDEGKIGLSELPNGIQMFKVFYDRDNLGFKGIVSEKSNEVRHSEIPKNYPLEAFLYYNKNGYSSYCKDYKEYWEWVKHRNPHRYNDNIKNRHNYDGKNMMHCLRMLDMAIEIGEGKGVNLVRPNRDWLLSVRYGQVEYDEILHLIEEKRKRMDIVFKDSDLPREVDRNMVSDILLKIRNYD